MQRDMEMGDGDGMGMGDVGSLTTDQDEWRHGKGSCGKLNGSTRQKRQKTK